MAPTSAAQKLKYHVQTSGRSLHAQEIAVQRHPHHAAGVDRRSTTTATRLHTNAYDEAITTPTDESVRRAMAIQLIINREWGLAKNENPSQGAFIIEELTELVEEAVLARVRAHQRARRCARRDGDRLPARPHPGRESMHYEMLKHTGELPHHRRQHLPQPARRTGGREHIELARSTEEEKQISACKRLADFQATACRGGTGHARATSAGRDRQDQNVFEVLMDAVRVCSLGQITSALFEVGGQYRRSM